MLESINDTMIRQHAMNATSLLCVTPIGTMASFTMHEGNDGTNPSCFFNFISVHVSPASFPQTPKKNMIHPAHLLSNTPPLKKAPSPSSILHKKVDRQEHISKALDLEPQNSAYLVPWIFFGFSGRIIGDEGNFIGKAWDTERCYLWYRSRTFF